MKKYELEEVSLFEAFVLPIWRSKLLVFAVAFAFGSLAALYAVTTPNYFKSKAVLATSSGTSGGLSSLVGQFGGLASMAGLNIGGGAGDPAVTIEELLKSPSFLYSVINKYDLLVPLMAVKSWNKEANTLILDKDIYDDESKVWTRDVPEGKSPKPTLWEAHLTLKAATSVNYRKKDGIFVLEVEHVSPHVAKQWVEMLVSEINQFYKNRDKEKIRKEINYLREQIAKTQVSEIKEVFYGIIGDKIKTDLLASTKDDYILSYIAKPVLADTKHRPKRALIVLIGLFIGGLVGSLIAIFRNK